MKFERVTLEDVQQRFLPELKKRGDLGRKITPVTARQVTEEIEVHDTIVNDEVETSRKSVPVGSWIVTNPGGEEYIMDNDWFIQSYIPNPRGEGYIKTSITFILPCPFNGKLEVSWGEMNVNTSGYLASDGTNVWFIDRNKFNETYEIILKNDQILEYEQ